MNVHNEELMTAMEMLSGETWMTIQIMPYSFFRSVLSWKIKLDEKKRNAMEERHKQMETEQLRVSTKERTEAKRQQRLAARQQHR